MAGPVLVMRVDPAPGFNAQWKIFHFSDEWKLVSVAPHREGGMYTPPHKSRGVFYTHIGHGN